MERGKGREGAGRGEIEGEAVDGEEDGIGKGMRGRIRVRRGFVHEAVGDRHPCGDRRPWLSLLSNDYHTVNG